MQSERPMVAKSNSCDESSAIRQAWMIELFKHARAMTVFPRIVLGESWPSGCAKELSHGA
eukprot:1917291-Pyramimonas_sp.AAC.1